MRYYFIFLLALLFIFNCSDNKVNMEEITKVDEQLKNDIKLVSEAKIFFGHQSVGYNIMEGLEQLNSKTGNQLNIIDFTNQSELPETFFLHNKNGVNEQPKTKCDAFSQILNNQLLDNLDVALFKFCYIDINKDSDVHELFDYYQKTIEQVKNEHPELKVVHVTVPLRLVQSGIKATIKKMMGKELGGVADNIKRNAFNDLLMAKYGNEIIFDLAKVESTYPDGKRVTFESNGKTYYSMAPEYTYDSGHLNKTGSVLAVKELLRTLTLALK